MTTRAPVVVLFAMLLFGTPGLAEETASYFPLQAGNWWAYEELGPEGTALSRETWRLLARAADDRSGEFHLHSSTKRLDALGRTAGHRWEGDEYLRATAVGIQKRYPAERSAGVEMVLLREPLTAGTRWHDDQGDCTVVSRGPCTGPRGKEPECAVIECRLGTPTAAIVSSTYARGVGMVRQEIDVVQFLPSVHGSGSVLLPCDSAQGGHSVLRLTAFHVAPR